MTTSSSFLISVGILGSTSIEKLDAILASLNQQTHQNLEILISGGAVPGPALIHYLRSKQASDARIKYVPSQGREGHDAPFQALLGKATGEFFVAASNVLHWHPRFLERCVAEIGPHGSVMSGASVSGQVVAVPRLGGGRRRYQDLLSFLRNPTSAILLGVHRTSWIKAFASEAASLSDQSLTLLRSVFRGHHRVFAEALCELDGRDDDRSEMELMPTWFAQGIKDLVMSVTGSNEGSRRKRELRKAYLSALSERVRGADNGPPTDDLGHLGTQEEMKASFSQSGEDMIVDFVFGAIQVSHPTYLDLGAHHPRRFSNTHHFYLKGSRGVSVEADPALFERFLQERSADINLNVGVGVGSMGSLPFYVMSVPTLNTFSKEEAERCVAMGTHQIVDVIEVPLRDVNAIIAEYFAGESPDFISIDVEGLDFEIVKSIDLQRYRPTVICVETITFSENFDGAKIEEIGCYLQQHGYFLYADTRINSIFVDKARWRR